MLEKIINNIVLITWSTWWLWSSLVEEFIKNNYYVIAWVKEKKQIWKNKKNLIYLKLDVTKEKEIIETLDCIKSIWKLKIIINNAAISGWGNIWERDIKKEKEIYDVNFFWPINLIKLSHNILEENSWNIINISSISADVPVPFISSYSSSKIALEKFMIWAFLEKRKSKIKVLNLKLWPLTKWLCWTSLPEEKSKYKRGVKNHLSKIQKLYWYPVEKVSQYILKHIKKEKKFQTKTLWIWAKFIVVFSKFFTQPYYQKLIWRFYKEIK